MNQLADENYVDLMIPSDIAKDYAPESDIFSLTPGVSIVTIPAAGLDECTLGRYPYHFFPAIFTLNAALEFDSGIQRVQDNPNLALFGQGVLIGVIDTGIDYRHAAFVNNDNTSRIYSLWDQTINENNTPPEGFFYGMEFNRGMLNAAIQSHDPLNIVPSQDEIGHGTMIAGMIMGNDARTGYQGVAPKAELVVVKLRQAKKINRTIRFAPENAICYQENNIIRGINYVVEVARQLDRPLALCVSLGSSRAHTSKSALGNQLNTICQSPRIGVAISGGNEGDKRRHYLGHVETGKATEFELRVGEDDKLFEMEIWQDYPHKLILDITSPTGQSFRNLYPTLDECRRLNFVLEKSVVWVNNIVTESQSGDQLILVRFQNPAAGLWKFSVVTVEGEASTFHAWLPSGDLISAETYFLDSNPETTITDPGNAIYPITLSNYDIKTNSIVISSSRGFTRGGFVKPDLASPGYQLQGPAPNHQYATGTGTGISAAIATGIMAMVLEWAVLKGNYTSITGTGISSLLIRGANQTHKDIVYPNSQWGYGVIDIYELFQKLI